MGLFDKVFGKSEQEKLNEAEGFAGLALSAIAADGQITPEEAQALGSNMMSKKLYQGYSEKQLNAMFNKLIGIINRDGVNVLIERSSEAISKELKPTAFAVSADLLLADGVMEENERKFLEKIQKSLGIPEDSALRIAEVISIKNRG